MNYERIIWTFTTTTGQTYTVTSIGDATDAVRVVEITKPD